MAHVVKAFDSKKGLPFWYVEERDSSDRVGPFSTREEAHAHLDQENRRRRDAGEPD